MIACLVGGDGVSGYPGDTCTYTCDTGYVLTNSNTRTCQRNGSWSGSIPMCSRSKQFDIYITYAMQWYFYTQWECC